jgi:signal transduction histidine kinase
VPIAGWANDSPVVFLANFSMVLTLGALCVYGPGRLIGLIRQLKAVREKTARMAVAHERERIAQDTHDLLGFGLSTITLKCELAQRLIGTDPERALREITEVLRLCAGVAQDTRSVAGAPQGLTLAREAAAAEAALRVGGATVRVELPAAALPVRVETVLATVLREAVTNVLRHSNPDCCGIQVEVADGVARLRVTNDGTFILNGLGSRALAEHGAEAPLVSPGHGLANLTRRTETAGGTLVAGPDGHGRFILQTEIPLHSGGLDRAEDVHVQP